jgi:choline dehydrogenase-like flavoprotein
MSEEFDVLIVGSGPVGSAFARRISRKGRFRILVAELGPFLTPLAGQNVRNLPHEQRQAAYDAARRYKAAGPVDGSWPENALKARLGTHLVRPGALGDPDDIDMPAATLASNVGGMGAHWTCACPRPGDTEIIPFIDTRRMDRAFDDAEAMLGVTQSGFKETEAGRFVLRTLSDLFDDGRPPSRRVQPMPLACRATGGRLPYWTGTDIVLGELADATKRAAAGVEIRAETLCRRLIVEGGRVVGAELEHVATGERYRIGAKAVAVAADALRTPQLLYASGIRSDALGHYLNDQPQVVSLIELDPDREWARSGDQSAGDLRDVVTGVAWIPFDAQRFPAHGQVMQLEASPVDVRLDKHETRGPVVGLGLFLPKEIRREDRVEFDDERTDYLGMPAIRIRYGLTSADREAVRQAKDVIRRAGERMGRFLPSGEPRLTPAGHSIHYQGSHRMGAENDGTSVCDSTSRVWGYDNLFLGGNGIIPTPIACNPTLTSVALATIAADAIVEQLDA